MKLTIPILLASLGGLMVFGALALTGPSTAWAEEVTFEQHCTGAEEVPAVSGPGSALARLTFDDETNVLSYQVTVRGISGGAVTAAHIHEAPAGSNGPVAVVLSPEPFTAVNGSVTLTKDQAATLLAGNYYINVHSNANPGGFARCQLTVPAQPEISPPSAGDAGLVASTGGSAAVIAASLALAAAGSGLVVVAARRRV